MRRELQDALLAEGLSRLDGHIEWMGKLHTAVHHLLTCPDTVNFKVTASVMDSDPDDPDVLFSEHAEDKDLQNSIRKVNQALKPEYQRHKEGGPKDWKPEVIYAVWCQAGPDVLIRIPEEHWKQWKYWL